MDYSTLPDRFRKRLDALRNEGDCASQYALLKPREPELPGSPDERQLTRELMAIAMNPIARARLEQRMDDDWTEDREKNMGMGSRTHEEVVIGAGYHAAVYCAVRAAMGKPPPLVIEQNARVGGIFACSAAPSFWSNSRNRPGPANAPGLGDGLNTVPGAPLQPSMISSSEFQSNADLAFVIRLTLAMSAKVASGKTVTSITRSNSPGTTWTLNIDGMNAGLPQFTIRAKRVIDARGLGAEKRVIKSGLPVNPYLMTFGEFMAQMDRPFPLRGLRRVAVIGDGDSGKCAVEALFGQNPAQHMSVPDLDRIERCDWYARTVPADCDQFRGFVRSRYKGIAPLLPTIEASNRAESRLRVIRARQAAVRGDYDGVFVGERRYDLAIYCGGFNGLRDLCGYDRRAFLLDGTQVAYQYGQGIFAVGPAADMNYTEAEGTQPWASLPENKIAMWRLGPRTALLASRL